MKSTWRLWVGHGTSPISHEPLSHAIVGVNFIDDGQVAYTHAEDMESIVSALNEVDEQAFLKKYVQQNGDTEQEEVMKRSEL